MGLCVKGAGPGSGTTCFNWGCPCEENTDNPQTRGPGYFWGENVQMCYKKKYQFTYYVRQMDPCIHEADSSEIVFAFASV